MEKREPFYTAGWNVNCYSHYGRQYRDSLKKKSRNKTNTAIRLLSTYPEDTKTEKEICTRNGHCSIIYNNQGHASNLEVQRQVNRKRLWYIYTMEYYSAIKRKPFALVLMRWLLETIIQNEISQKGENEHHILTHIYGTFKMILKNLFSEQQWRCRHREHTYGQGWGRRGRGWDKWREWHGCIHTNICKEIANGNLLDDSGNSN